MSTFDREMQDPEFKKQFEKEHKNFLSAEAVLAELSDPVEGPASILRGLRYRAELTQKQLAEKLDIRQHHLSEMENGKRSIGKAMAQKFAGVFDCDFRVLL